MTKKYAVIHTISHFRHIYAIPMEDTDELIHMKDLVTCEEVKEFSQEHISEDIYYATEMTENEVLKLFDEQNDYLSGWSTEKKLEWINNWKEEL